MFANKLYQKLPLLLILSGLYNLIFKSFGFDYLYVLFYIIGFLWSLTKPIKINFKKDFIIILFFILLVFNNLINIATKELEYKIVFMGTLLYLLPMLFWFLYYKTVKNFDLPKLILNLKYHVLIIALLGLVQFYVSPDLFGFLNSENNNMLTWSLEDQYYQSFFRSYSILTSPQIFGGFMILYLVAFISSIQSKRILAINNIIPILIIGISGMHSANKSFFLLLALYLIIKVFKTKSIKLIFLTIFVFMSVFLLRNDYPFISRVLSSEVVSQEKEGRLSIWYDLIKKSSFIGEGAATHINTNFTTKEVIAAESYYFQILSELGMIMLILFLILIIMNIVQIKNTNYYILNILCATMMIFVHTFNNPAYILFWGICLYGFYHTRQNKILNFDSIKKH